MWESKSQVLTSTLWNLYAASGVRTHAVVYDQKLTKDAKHLLKTSPLDLSGIAAIIKEYKEIFACSRVRTCADNCPPELESGSLDHSDIHAVLNSRIELLTSA